MFKLLLALFAIFLVSCTSVEKTQPNVIFILADDLGYGDVGCYNPESKIPTPNLDRLAKEGMRFTDAHSPSTVCTPSRYSLLTGRMAFRTGKRGVFVGVGGPSLIQKDRLTIAGMMKEQGYNTAMFGKWHIGMTFYDKQGNLQKKGGVKEVQNTDFSRKIPDAPVYIGFDEFFGTVSCPTTDWLYAFVDGDKVPVPPAKLLDKKTIPQHYYGLDCRQGMIAPDFDMEEVDILFLNKTLKFIEKQDKNKPFFLVHSTQAVHLPSFPAKINQGKTNSGPHGDFIFQFDYVVGQIVEALKKKGLAENTLIMISSDNGPEVPTVLHMREHHKHDGSRPWRGVKRDSWEGGHRVPMIAWWPGKIKPESVADQPVSLTDVMATCAEMTGFELPANTAEDSFSFLHVLNGSKEKVRDYLIAQTWTFGMSIREGKWKYLDHKGSAGSRYSGEGHWSMKKYALPERLPDAPGQLFDMSKDPGERTNIYDKHPEIVKKLKAKLEEFKSNGHSDPPHVSN